mmetsp:Transcript_3710/g.9450  ORF Transcript_3710/g.9450 Transcript_3710/m.9450 type:complete len:201 (-) Transcript_3710:67-669(-)
MAFCCEDSSGFGGNPAKDPAAVPAALAPANSTGLAPFVEELTVVVRGLLLVDRSSQSVTPSAISPNITNKSSVGNCFSGSSPSIASSGPARSSVPDSLKRARSFKPAMSPSSDVNSELGPGVVTRARPHRRHCFAEPNKTKPHWHTCRWVPFRVGAAKRLPKWHESGQRWSFTAVAGDLSVKSWTDGDGIVLPDWSNAAR